MKLVWSPKYQVDLLGHIFPVVKYRLTQEAALEAGIISDGDLVEAPRPAREDLLLAHTPGYIDDLMNLRWTHRTQRSEMALTREIAEAYIYAAGGTTEAARIALEEMVCVHNGGGFHHAFPDHAEGFCYINDVAVAARRLKKDGFVKRVAVIDCDLHQGNGTAYAFRDEPDVFTFSIHQENNYPLKERSNLDIGLPDGAGDGQYLKELEVVHDVLDRHQPDIVFYLAGADPFLGDQLGGLALTKEGLRRRDGLVFGALRARDIPVAAVFAGGYAADVADDVDIHLATIREAAAAPGKGRDRGPKKREPQP